MTSTLQTLAFKLAPPARDSSPERFYSCEERIERRYEIVPSVVCSMCCLFGMIYCFFGYRCFKAVMFLTGLMFGSVVIFMLCYKERVLDTQLNAEASAGIGLGIGVLCGLVTMLVRSVGLFMVGLLLGLLVAVAALLTMEEFYHPRTVWVPLGMLLGSGMLFAVLALRWERCFTTLSTAVFGSAVITVTVDYFAELFALVHHVYERIKVAPAQPVCWFTWVILGVWPVLTVLGIVIQWKVTGEGYSHTEVIISRQQRRIQLMRIRQKEERRERRKRKKKKQQQQQQQQQQPQQQEPQPHATHTHSAKPLPTDPAYRRKPNPIRRFDGDVLSPSYIQSFQDRQVDRRRYPRGRLTGGPHTTMDLDYDYGSTVPLTASGGPAVRV
ncbi:transmembrane protein 198-like [Paramormyrops kingsleyae]|uniref:Transmembrane protein 198 n=1 Tax=Paramormyrops kingsleyae TaxID=1676925 RepID=A0A3B3R778_9TELE|nr:transmembrane protein 198-B-like [Paramormyrops kingsleyae]XP_023661650.1 transmembrane protein 198-B-like [Paramormyrops kingsleyae]XP_023661651.1 transmembrane protein 198-B-like [Paramormyrops kingsleyae]